MEMFDAVHDWFNDRVPSLQRFYGCFSLTPAVSTATRTTRSTDAARLIKQKVFELLKRHALEISTSETEADELANALFLLKEGAIVKAHVEGDLDAAFKQRQLPQG